MARKKKRARTGESDRAQRKEQRRVAGQNSSANQEDDPMYDEVDLFHLNKDKIAFDEDSEGEGSEKESDDQEAVFDLNVPESSSEEDNDDEDKEASEGEGGLTKSSKSEVADESSDGEEEESDEEDPGLKNWGRSKKAYYSGDTADLEIGQEIEDALDEEEAVLELQRERMKTLKARDFQGSDSESSDEEEDDEEEEKGQPTIEDKLKTSREGKGKKEKKKKKGLKPNGINDSSMHTDIALASFGRLKEGEVEEMKVERNLSQLTKEDRLELILSESPELLSLLSEAESMIEEFRDTINPLATTVTQEMGASEDGLRYLATKHELLLSFIMNVAFYLLLKAEGRPVKHHPVMGQILEVRKLLQGIAPIDEQLKPQIQVLLKALAGEIPEVLNSPSATGQESPEGVTDNEDEDSSAESEDGEEDSQNIDKIKQKKLETLRLLAEKEEEMFMKEVPVQAKKKKKKKRHLSDIPHDYGDVGVEDDEIPPSRRKVQAVVNQLTQKGKSKAKKQLSGDTDIPFRDPKVQNISSTSVPSNLDEDDFEDAEKAEKQKVQKGKDEFEDEEDAFYKAVSLMKKQKKKEKSEKYKVHKLTKEPEQVDADNRRGVSYEIIANRGLVAHKKKLNRNPRVKKRVAYEKAVIRRKGQVRELRTGETDMYGGELTGIRSNVSRSRKIKN